MRLIWQTPKLFKNSGLFLKVGNRRVCILPWPLITINVEWL